MEKDKKNNKLIQSRILLYTSLDGDVRVDVYFQDETFWMTQKTMGELFGVAENTITYHLQETFKSGELKEISTTRKIRAVRIEGKRTVLRELQFYNLDAIIAVRIQSKL